MAETGHARNVEHFAMMISFCTGYGADYNPSNAMIELAALNIALTDAQAAIDDVAAKVAPWKLDVADRENIYKGIRPLSTRIANAYAVTGAEQNAIDNIESLKKRIHGARVNALPEDDPNTPENEAEGNSVAHQSYVQIAEAFSQMIKQLDEDPLYAPNEVDLQTATLTTRLTEMQNANAAVIATATPLSNSRIARNEKLYGEDTGVCDLAALVKKYVKSVYGADSPQYEQISGLEFRSVN